MFRLILVAVLLVLPLWFFEIFTVSLPPTPSSITLPLPPLSATEHIEFPSDKRYSGGPPYIVIDIPLTIADIPKDGWCETMPYRLDTERFWFDCSWYDTTRKLYARTDVAYAFKPGDVHDAISWEFDQVTLSLNATVNSWYGFDSTLFLGIFALGCWCIALMICTSFFTPKKVVR